MHNLKNFGLLLHAQRRAFNYGQFPIGDKFIAKKRYLKLAKTFYKTCHLFHNYKSCQFLNNGVTLFAKKSSSFNFVHFMYPFSARLLLRRKLWGTPLRRNENETKIYLILENK